MIKKIVALLLFTAFFAACYLLYLFMEANSTPVAFTLIGLGGRPPMIWNPPTFLLVFSSFFAGLFAASILFVGQSFRQSWRMRRMKKEIERFQRSSVQPSTPQPETFSRSPKVQDSAQPAQPALPEK